MMEAEEAGELDGTTPADDPAIAQFWEEYSRASAASAAAHTHFRVCFRDNGSAGDTMKDTRVAVILRGQYAEATRVEDCSVAGANHVEFEAVIDSPAILNEVRVRAVASGGGGPRYVAGFTVFGATPPSGHGGKAQRLDSPWVKEEVVGADGSKSLAYGVPWCLLVEQREHTGDDLEVRCFVLCNVPRVRPPSCSAALRGALLGMANLPAAWTAALGAPTVTPLTVTLARLLLEERSKLKAFLARPAAPSADTTPSPVDACSDGSGALLPPLPADVWFRRGAGGPPSSPVSASPRLKAWPSKGGVQQLVALWMCVGLVGGHEYTEPELYAHVTDLCACQPDHGVVRKEMVRHGYLEQPVIRTNADKTTSTTYQVGVAAVEAALRSELLGALVKTAHVKPGRK